MRISCTLYKARGFLVSEQSIDVTLEDDIVSPPTTTLTSDQVFMHEVETFINRVQFVAELIERKHKLRLTE